ncbi:MAG: peptidyl-tRNA hydrolase Pth2 [Candidatus Micrarchaeota archaeon]|nr:peptidyl-tRNA hydrolase Pth2 [Candidatus Micrarchaeota archaeon]
MLDEIKQVIIVRSDLQMGKGKAVAQACHAAIRAFEAACELTPRIVSGWKMQGEKKIVVKAPLAEMQGIFSRAKRAGLPCALIQDAGLTQLEPGTVTAMAIGPAKSSEVDALTKHLKLL